MSWYKHTVLHICFIAVATLSCRAQVNTDSLFKESFREKDIPVNEYMIDILRPIRENFYTVNSMEQWDSVNKVELSPIHKNVYAKYYYKEGTLRKIIFKPRDEKLDEYYFLKGSLCLIIEKGVDTTINEPDIKKSYFTNKGLIHQVVSGDCGAPWASEYLEEEEYRLVSEYRYLIERRH